MKFEHLTLREKVCQLMAPRAKDYLKDGYNSANYPVGFIFVDTNDYKADEETGIRNVDAVTAGFESKVPLGIVADGVTGFAGVRTPLRKPRMGAANDEDLAFRCGKAFGMQMIYNKIDWTLEPACDLVQHPMSHMFCDAFGGIPEINAAMASACIKGIQSVGVAATTKHFPGMGTSPTNFHWAKARNLLSKEEWDKTFGYVYQEIINAGVASIMTSHIALPAYSTKGENGKYPEATISHELTTGLLKEKLGFKGVVVTDALTMGGCECNNTAKVCVEAFEAGADVLLFANLDSVDVITEKLEKGEIPMSRLEDALNRIYELKKMTGILDKKRNTACLDEEFVRQVHNEEVQRGIIVKTFQAPMFPIDKQKVKKICVAGINCGGNPDFTPFVKRLEEEGFEVDFKQDLFLKNEKVAKEFQEEYDLILFTFAGSSTVPVIPGDVGMPTVWTVKRIDPHKKYIIQFSMPKMYDLYFQDEPVYVNPLEGNPGYDLEVVDNLVKVLIGERVATGEFSHYLEIDENY